MMVRSLATKLTLAFLLVGLTGAVLVALLVRQQTRARFDQLVVSQNQQTLINNLTAYYQQYGSWEGVDEIFHGRPLIDTAPLPVMPDGRSPWGVGRVLFSIADPGGKIFYGHEENLGRKLARRDLEQYGVELEVDGELVGWLIFSPFIDRWRPGTPEGDFLFGVNRAIFISAGIATLIALLLGGFLAYSLTRSLRELTTATQELAKGKLGHQVRVTSKDELGTLAASFNQMSTELANANELRKQMTADVAHDLRNPLSVILGYTEALSDGKLQGRPETFKTIYTEAQHLSRLIEDLKTLSLADAGELPLMRQRINPRTLLQRAAGAFQIRAAEKEIQIVIEGEDTLPQVEVDVERMAQVLGNLLSNALRYTPTGGRIRLSAAAENGGVRLQVHDNGSGIAPADLPHIFERSYRGDKARHSSGGETGLGLAIAKSLVEAHGGSIAAASEPEMGTTFTLRLPASG